MDQMTIFDYLTPENIETMTDGQIAEIINHKTGLNMVLDKGIYSQMIGRVQFTLHKSRYSVPPYTEFISCGVQTRGGSYAGESGPYDTIDSAVGFYKRALERYTK